MYKPHTIEDVYKRQSMNGAAPSSSASPTAV